MRKNNSAFIGFMVAVLLVGSQSALAGAKQISFDKGKKAKRVELASYHSGGVNKSKAPKSHVEFAQNSAKGRSKGFGLAAVTKYTSSKKTSELNDLSA